MRYSRLAPISLILAIPPLFFWRETLGWLTLGDQDAVFWFFPAYSFLADSLRSGDLPIWNPDYYCGVPLFAQWQSGMLDPFNWVYLAGATSRTLTLSLELGFGVAMLGMYWYCRTIGLQRKAALFGAIIYGLSGFAVARTLYPGLLHIHALTPLTLTMTERLCRRRRAVDVAAGALVVAWQVFAAHPQPLIYSSLLAVGWALFRIMNSDGAETRRSRLRLLLQVAAMFVLGGALAAIQLIPAAEAAGRSVRQDWPYELFTLHSIHPTELLTSIIPFFSGGGESIYHLPYWGISWHHNESQIYTGILALALATGGAAMAIRRRYRPGIFWVVVVLAGVALVLGRYFGPLAHLLYHVPLLNRFRSPNRHWMEVIFAVAFLAGYAVDRLLSEPVTALALVVRRVAIFLGLLTVGIGGMVLGARGVAERLLRLLPDWHALPAGFLNAAGWEFALPMVTSAVVSMALFVWLRPVNRQRWYGMILLLLLADYQIYALCAPVSHPPRIEHQLGRAIPEGITAEERISPPFRTHIMLSPAEGQFSPLLFYGHEMVGGYDPLLNERFKTFSGIEEAGRTYLKSMLDPADRTLDLLNARYVMIPSGSALPPGSARWQETSWRSPAPEYAGYRIVENRQVMPRAWLVRHAVPAWEGDQLKLIRGEKLDAAGRAFDPQRTALVDMPVDGQVHWFSPFLPTANSATASDILTGSVTLLGRDHDYVRYRTTAGQPSILVLSETALPGWIATIDGHEVPWHRVNFILRGLPLPPGDHLVEFVYRPLSMKIGAAISTIAALVCAVMFIRHRSRPITDSASLASPLSSMTA